MTELRFIIAAIFFLLAAAAILIATAGVFKFKYVMNRMHSAALIDAFAVLCTLIGLAIVGGSIDYIPKLVLVLIFLWIGSPIASHMVGRLEIRTDESVSDYMDTKEADIELGEDEWVNDDSDGSDAGIKEV